MKRAIQRRSAAELFGQLYSLQVESMERTQSERYEREARAAHDRLLASATGKDDIVGSLARVADELRAVSRSRVAYVEAHDDESKETAAQVLRNAVAWFAERGVSVERATPPGTSTRRSGWAATSPRTASSAKSSGELRRYVIVPSF